MTHAMLVQWERVKKAGLAPSPARASFGLACHNERAIIFGGVSDQKGQKDAVYSEHFNEMYQFGLQSRRWYPVSMRVNANAAAQVRASGWRASRETGFHARQLLSECGSVAVVALGAASVCLLVPGM